jgi:hypothetical protein
VNGHSIRFVEWTGSAGRKYHVDGSWGINGQGTLIAYLTIWFYENVLGQDGVPHKEAMYLQYMHRGGQLTGSNVN